MKTAIALALTAMFATSSANAQTVAAPTAPVGIIGSTGLSGATAAVGIAAAIIVVGAAVAIGSDNDDNNTTNGSN